MRLRALGHRPWKALCGRVTAHPGPRVELQGREGSAAPPPPPPAGGHGSSLSSDTGRVRPQCGDASQSIICVRRYYHTGHGVVRHSLSGCGK